ncbi:MAG: hypothetical protein WCA63_00140 [Gallionella sp.]
MDKVLNMTFGTISTKILIDALRSFDEWRQRVLSKELTDNLGAIHSGERIAEMLSLKIAYPGLTHINNLRHHKELAWFSKKAKAANNKETAVEIEHVYPKRAYTIALLRKLSKTEDTVKIEQWIKKNFKLVLLTRSERANLDKINRTKKRDKADFEAAGIDLCDEPTRALSSRVK